MMGLCICASWARSAWQGSLRITRGQKWKRVCEDLRIISRGLIGSPQTFADALTYCDVTTAPDGSVVGLEERLADVADRRDAGDPVVVALRVARPEIQRAVDAIEARLARMGER